jgi:mycoredoxin
MTMIETPILMYATNWCPDCVRVRRYLDEHKIKYTWLNINEDPEARAYVEKVNRGFQSVPTMVWPDGSTLVEPSIRQLVAKLESYG